MREAQDHVWHELTTEAPKHMCHTSVMGVPTGVLFRVTRGSPYEDPTETICFVPDLTVVWEDDKITTKKFSKPLFRSHR